MATARFFERISDKVVREFKGDVISLVYPNKPKGFTTVEERLPEPNCVACDCLSWIILPKDNEIVIEGGKPYIECLNCGHITHL